MTRRFLIFAVAGAGLALAGWNTLARPIGDLGAAEARAVSAGLGAHLSENRVVLVEPVRTRPDADGTFVCGWLSRSAALANLGPMPFVGILFRNGTFRVASVAVTEGERQAVRTVCLNRGLVISAD